MPRLRPLTLLATLLTLFTLYTLHNHLLPTPFTHKPSSPPLHPLPLSCPTHALLNNILVVLKTGVTESRTKVPIHLTTTLRCIPNYAIFSDYIEPLTPTLSTHDVLSSLSPALIAQNPDFDLYRRVHAAGPSALTPADLNPDTNTPIGKPNNPGWKLDKWKFLPMLETALAVKPDAEWYVFMEADTFIVWENLLRWLERFDTSEKWYLGNQMQIVDAIFAHGGSGFILSRPAVEAAVERRKMSSDGWERAVMEHWAGDCMLGLLLEDAGVPLTWAWPMVQIAPPGEMDYFSRGYEKRPWCYPVVSFHHLDARGVAELEGLLGFGVGGEGKRGMRGSGKGGVVLWRDVFLEMVRPQVQSVRMGWDNLADGDVVEVKSFAACRGVCVREALCLQYRFNETDGSCATSKLLMVGRGAADVASGWMTERIDAVAGSLGECREVSWIG